MDVLEGQLTTDLPKPVSKCIRLFLSSDLTGTQLYNVLFVTYTGDKQVTYQFTHRL